MIDLKKLIEAGVHFGHKTSRWHPKMMPYIWGSKNNVHLIDVSKTALQLEKATKFLEEVAAQGKTILLIGTKKAAQPIITEMAQRLRCPFVTHRWIGGTLTNSLQVRKSITKLLHLEDVLKKSEHSHYTKKELVSLQKIVDRLQKNVGSIRNISWPIGAVVIVDVKKEQTGLREAGVVQIPVVGLVDTNSDPSLVDYVIPSNDDAPKAIKTIIDYIAEAIQRGQEKTKAGLSSAEKVALDSDLVAIEAPLLTETEEDEGLVEEEKRTVKKMKKEKELLEKPRKESAPIRTPAKKK